MSEKQIWDRQEGETDASWSAFCLYRDDLSGRTLLKAYRQHKNNWEALNVPGWFAAWSATHNWVERVRAYDAALEKQAREEREALWLGRQRQLVEDEWQASRTLLEKATAMLDEPILGLKWTADTPVRYFQLAAALGRAATGLDVVKHEHTGADGGPVEHVTMSLSEWKDLATERRKAAEEALEAASYEPAKPDSANGE